MLGRKPKEKQETTRTEPFTYIHRGTTVTGDLEAQGRVRVHGEIRGNVKVSGVLEVAEAGVIEGDVVEADDVKILGRVHASVSARGKIEIWKDGELVGDVRAAALDIEEGAAFTGRSEMTAQARTAPRLPESATGVRREAVRSHEEPATLGEDAQGGPAVADREV